MFLWISSNSCPLNLLLVGSHQAELIIIKRLIQGRNNETRVRVEPRPFDQGRRKNDAFTHSSTLPTKVSQKRRNFLKLITKGCLPSLSVSPGGVCIKKRPKHNFPSTSSQIKQQNFDKRSPGLFELEWDGTGFIGLCSKTYFRFGVKDKQVSKLVKVKQNQFNLSTVTQLF